MQVDMTIVPVTLTPQARACALFHYLDILLMPSRSSMMRSRNCHRSEWGTFCNSTDLSTPQL